MARLGLYQLSLASPEFLPLLKFAIRADTIVDSCVLILMDWTRPWKFLETLERWINVLHYLIDEICKEGIAADTNWSKGRAVVDEIKEKRKPTTHERCISFSMSSSCSGTLSTDVYRTVHDKQQQHHHHCLYLHQLSALCHCHQ